MKILGVSAYYHDSAACLVDDGEIVSAVQEERFTRKKHDPGFPHRPVDYRLKAGGIQLRFVFYDKPLIKVRTSVGNVSGFCTGNPFEALFGGSPRKPESKLTQREMDLARSIQEVTEEAMLRLARILHRETHTD